MRASILDLRYKMRAVLEGLDRGETVTITHQGKKRAIIMPLKNTEKKNVSNHEFFGMIKNDTSVKEIMSQLRKKRYDF